MSKRVWLMCLGSLLLLSIVSMPLVIYSGYLRSESTNDRPDNFLRISELSKQLQDHNELLQLIMKLEETDDISTGKSHSVDSNTKFSLIETKLENLDIEIRELEGKLVEIDKTLKFAKVSTNDGSNTLNSATSRDNHLSGPVQSKIVPFGLETVLLIICYNRADYLAKTLDYIFQYHPKTGIPVVISQDGTSDKVSQVIQQFKVKFASQFASVPFIHLIHTQQQISGDTGYHKLARHYKWAFSQCFHSLSMDVTVERVIVLEDDLQISSDFFQYFQALSPYLDNPDENLLAISAWNDNGQKSHVFDAKQVYRSDFFPGLGWMMHKRTWNELEPIWPQAYWDDWLREDKNRKGRHVLRPEICRTFHFGVVGTSNSQYSAFLSEIALNTEMIDYEAIDFSYLSVSNWRSNYLKQVNSAPKHTWQAAQTTDQTEIRVSYTDEADFERFAKYFKIMDNIKAHVPRTAFDGIISFWWVNNSGRRVKVHLYRQE